MAERSSNGRERLAELRAAEARKERNRKVAMLGGALVAALAVTGGGIFLVNQGNKSGSNGEIAGVKSWSNLSRDHVEGDPTFPMTPPVGGAHNATWANCGVYDKEVPNKYAVHSLEHGAVWITYSPKASKSDVSTLKKLANQEYILMSPYEKQDAPVTLSAWGKQLKVQSASDKRVDQFIREYRQGPQTPEPGAACTGGYDPNAGTLDGTMPQAD